MLWPEAGSRGAASLHLALPSGARARPRRWGVEHHRAPSSSRSNGVSIRVTAGSSGSSLATTSGIVTPASSSSAVSASGPAKQALVRAAAARVGVALLLAAVGDRSPPSSEWRAAGGAGPRQSAGCCRTMAE